MSLKNMFNRIKVLLEKIPEKDFKFLDAVDVFTKI